MLLRKLFEGWDITAITVVVDHATQHPLGANASGWREFGYDPH